MKLHKFFWLILFVIVTACTGQTSKAPSSKETAYVASAQKWGTTTLVVCFLNPNAANNDDLWQIQNAVELAYHDSTVLRFNGWQSCDSSENPNIIIRISNDMIGPTPDAWPRTVSLGRSLQGKNPGMYLSTAFNNICAEDSVNKGTCALTSNSFIPKADFSRCLSSENARISCIRNIAVHEFGHAIGLSHEQNRADTPTACKALAQGENGDTTYGTQWDFTSVMNYCNPTWNNNGVLSRVDEFGIASLYGFPVESPEVIDNLAATSYIY